MLGRGTTTKGKGGLQGGSRVSSGRKKNPQDEGGADHDSKRKEVRVRAR